MRYMPAPLAGTAYSVVAVIAAACAVKSTVAYSDGRPLDTNVILLYLLALVSPDKSAKSGLITVIAAPAVACFRNCPVPPVADKLAFVPPFAKGTTPVVKSPKSNPGGMSAGTRKRKPGKELAFTGV